MAERYDLILAINGYHPILAYKRALSPGGTYIMLGGSIRQGIEGLLLAPLVSTFRMMVVPVCISRR